MREVPTLKRALARQVIHRAAPDQGRELTGWELAAIFLGALSLAALAAHVAGWLS
jgi:hypothetical protein